MTAQTLRDLALVSLALQCDEPLAALALVNTMLEEGEEDAANA